MHLSGGLLKTSSKKRRKYNASLETQSVRLSVSTLYTYLQPSHITSRLLNSYRKSQSSSLFPVHRDSSVGTATCYGLDGLGIISLWGTRFSAPVHTYPGAHPASYTIGTWSFPVVKWPRRGVDHPPPHLAPRLKKEQNYTSTPSLGLRGFFWGEIYLSRLFPRGTKF